ncbi:glycosyltransferase family 39 protein [Thioalkalicoccus limnaeus]|uniref:Glycosyltransferase family 39 protein n=1 Tax=Thioalkalicoccus limnaeus TaxID=120681 RepID=A0ABV4BA71_9GAMM
MEAVQRPRRSPHWALWLILVVVGITLWRILAAWLMPVTQDEAYYFDWARHLAWGYFDHPPGVALLGLGIWLEPGSTLAGRLGNLIAATATLFVLLSFYRNAGLASAQDRLLALVLAVATIPGLAVGVLTTPDSVLALAWALALHEALAALQRDRRRWVAVGVVVGLGLLGKYTMVLIGPVLLWALLRADPGALRTRWPYLGALAALLVFLPHLIWNAQHDWLTMRFQFGHGFALDTGAAVDTALPEPLAAAATPVPVASPGWGGLLGYAGQQIALLGVFALPLLAALFGRGAWRRIRADLGAHLDPKARPLLHAGTLVPLAFFAVAAWRSEAEANWPVVYLLAAAPLLALAARPLWRWLMAAAAINVLLVSLYVVHGATAALPLPDSGQRILRETYGFRELAELAARLDGPVFTDRYQATAMLRFYAPPLGVGQWPGLTRPSEYLRGSFANGDAAKRIEEASGFWLIARSPGHELPGFRLAEARTLFICQGEGVIEAADPPCAQPLRVWRLYRYQPESIGG